MDTTPFEALLFDLDGTLVDSSQDIADSLNYTLKKLGLAIKTEAEVERLVGDGMKTLLIRATGTSEEAFIQKAIGVFKPYYFDHCVDRTTLYPGALEVLKFFESKKLAVVSNKPYDMVLKTLKHFQILDRFQAVLGGESTRERKPHPEPVLKSLEIMNVSPESALFVGDGTADMEAGKGAGVKICAALYGYRSRRELEAYHPDFMIEALPDLTNLIY